MDTITDAAKRDALELYAASTELPRLIAAAPVREAARALVELQDVVGRLAELCHRLAKYDTKGTG